MNGYALELIAHYHLLVYVVAISYRMTIRRERGKPLVGQNSFLARAAHRRSSSPINSPVISWEYPHVYVRAYIKHETL